MKINNISNGWVRKRVGNKMPWTWIFLKLFRMRKRIDELKSIADQKRLHVKNWRSIKSPRVIFRHLNAGLYGLEHFFVKSFFIQINNLQFTSLKIQILIKFNMLLIVFESSRKSSYLSPSHWQNNVKLYHFYLLNTRGHLFACFRLPT